MGSIIFKRLASFVVAAGGWMLLGVRTALDLVGWSTAPDDVGVAMTRLDQILAWIIGLPWGVPWGFALISTMWLMWVSWPRAAPTAGTERGNGNQPATEPMSRHYNEDGSYPNYFFDHAAHESLTNFAVEKVIPAGYAQELLQRTIIEKLTDNAVLQDYAARGLPYQYSYERNQFRDGFSELSGRLAGSPMEYVPFQELVDCVDQIEKGYKAFCRQTVELAGSSEKNLLQDQSVREAWEEWREAHNTLVSEYDQVKRESKYGKLYRPQKPSRWGGPISLLPKGEPLPFLLPPDIAEEKQR
ncbi:hypothetical protein NKJ51_22995 [Mesorhizobium sp. M0134]|uniref:hypothetical protein n=1 Tax=Mesorhizobium sp. M0134 TaxID=2956889 RepID=UPI00333B7113